MKPLNIGLIGYGFMGRAHSNAFRKVSNFFDLEYQPILKAICARDETKVKAFARKWGYESQETDWRKLIAREDIDLVDIACPNDMHREIALAAAKAGKMILCEKPLAMNGPEGLKMVQAVEKAWTQDIVNNDVLKKYATSRGALFAPLYGEQAQAAVFPAVQANAWLLFETNKAKVSPDTVGIPKP